MAKLKNVWVEIVCVCVCVGGGGGGGGGVSMFETGLRLQYSQMCQDHCECV
jgi:hypothetical protein